MNYTGFNSLNSLEVDQMNSNLKQHSSGSSDISSDSQQEQTSSPSGADIESSKAMSESGGSDTKTKMFKGNIYDLGLNLPAAEIKKIFNQVREALLSSQGTIDEYDIISGGENLMNY